MDAPQSAAWGPNLWMVLHSAAERIGTLPCYKNMKQAAFDAEETRLWSNLLSSLRFSIPCPLCKKHYGMYYARNRPIVTKNIVTWLWELHVDVNRRLGRSDGLDRDLLSTVYGQPFEWITHWAIVREHMLRAMRLGWCTREDTMRTLRFAEELRIWYHFT